MTLMLPQMCKVNPREAGKGAKASHKHHPERLQFLFNFSDEITYSGKYLWSEESVFWHHGCHFSQSTEERTTEAQKPASVMVWVCVSAQLVASMTSPWPARE